MGRWTRRAAWGLVLLACAGAAAAELGLELVVDGLDEPVYLATTPLLGDERLFVVGRTGRIDVLESGQILTPPFLDITACDPPDCVDVEPPRGEGGLLGLAFSPDYASDGVFYVYYTAGDPAVENDLESRLARFRVLGDPATSNLADPTSEEILFTAAQPFRNHNGGTIAFSGGRLYLGLGDGGAGSDENAQDDASPLGKLLRFDVSQTPPPVEVVAKGLRNPFRFSFDDVTGALYIGDVGQQAWEEVDVVAAADLVASVPLGQTAPLNFGWDVEEGPDCFDPTPPAEPPCGDPELIPPTHFYANDDETSSVIGGVVYRGPIRELRGHYVFGDLAGPFGSFLWQEGIGIVGDVVDRTDDFALPPGIPIINGVVAVVGDDAGDLYVVGKGTAVNGHVFRLVPEPGAGAAVALAVLALLRRSAP